MNNIVKRDKCDHCRKKVSNVEVKHGFNYNFFDCPYCQKENKRIGDYQYTRALKSIIKGRMGRL